MTSTSSLSGRLIIAALIWLALVLAVGGGVLASAFRDTVEQEFTLRLESMLRAMVAATEITSDGAVVMVRPLGDPRFDQIFSGWYWQVSEANGRQVRSRSLWDSAIPPVDGGTQIHTRRIEGPKGEPLMVVESDLDFPGAAGPVHLLIAADLREVHEGVRRFHMLLITALGLLGAGMAVAIVIQVRFGLRPLRGMAADLMSVRRGERARLPDDYPREVAPLAEAVNAVLAKDAELIERARTHVGNLAHGLKTPLAVIAAEIAGSSGENKRVVTDQIQAMRRLIEHHLGRASAVAGGGQAMGVKIAVREVAQGIAMALGRVFADRSLVFDIDAPADASFRGHREDIEEILGNLMENSAKWASARVRVSARESLSGLILTVEDDGPGLSRDQAAEASRRGKRLDEISPGWGLGLSIVSDIVEVNGGEMAFSISDLGGLAVSIHLPKNG